MDHEEDGPVARHVVCEEPWNPERARIIGNVIVCGSEEPRDRQSVKVPSQETALNHMKLFFGIKGRSKKKDEDEEEAKPEAKSKRVDSDDDDLSEEESEEESEYSEEEAAGDSDS